MKNCANTIVGFFVKTALAVVIGIICVLTALFIGEIIAGASVGTIFTYLVKIGIFVFLLVAMLTGKKIAVKLFFIIFFSYFFVETIFVIFNSDFFYLSSGWWGLVVFGVFDIISMALIVAAGVLTILTIFYKKTLSAWIHYLLLIALASQFFALIFAIVVVCMGADWTFILNVVYIVGTVWLFIALLGKGAVSEITSESENNQ